MERHQPIVIDDVAAAIGRMTPLGRDLLRVPAALVREAVLLYAARRDWKVVSHETFLAWACERVDPDYLWLVLDPMIPDGVLPVAARAVRLTRRPGVGGWVIDDEVAEAVKRELHTRNVGVIDDAASTGRTAR